MFLIEDGGDVEDTLARGQRTMRLDVASHTVDYMRHGHTRVGVVGVVIDDGASVDSLVGTQRIETLVPVDMAGGQKCQSKPHIKQ